MAEVFISYSIKDQAFRAELENHLEGLTFHSNDPIDWWSDARLAPGSLWGDELFSALNTCRIALLLVSKNFLASNFIANEELPQIFDRIRNQDGLKIFWVLLSPCAWQYTPIADYSAISDLSKPLSSMRPDNRNKFWSQVLIPEIMQELSKLPPAKFPRLVEDNDPFGLREKSFIFNVQPLLEWFNQYAPSSPPIDKECIEILRGLANNRYQTKIAIELTWNAPEPNQIQLFSPEIEEQEIKTQMTKPWGDFELLSARLYPRFRDAHLALLLHERFLKNSSSNIDLDDDRYHVKRILRGILRKQGGYNTALQSLSALEEDQEELDKFCSHHSSFLLCHIALLWAIEERVFSSSIDNAEQRHWLFVSTRLCERTCHWLLQAHSVARNVVEAHDKTSHISATSPLIGRRS